MMMPQLAECPAHVGEALHGEAAHTPLHHGGERHEQLAVLVAGCRKCPHQTAQLLLLEGVKTKLRRASEFREDSRRSLRFCKSPGGVGKLLRAAVLPAVLERSSKRGEEARHGAAASALGSTVRDVGQLPRAHVGAGCHHGLRVLDQRLEHQRVLLEPRRVAGGQVSSHAPAGGQVDVVEQAHVSAHCAEQLLKVARILEVGGEKGRRRSSAPPPSASAARSTTIHHSVQRRRSDGAPDMAFDI